MPRGHPLPESSVDFLHDRMVLTFLTEYYSPIKRTMLETVSNVKQANVMYPPQSIIFDVNIQLQSSQSKAESKHKTRITNKNGTMNTCKLDTASSAALSRLSGYL